MTSCALAIFVKTPGHSPIKTRLAATRGQAYAEQFHSRAATVVAETVQLAARAARTRGHALQAHWAVAEPAATQSPQWAGLPRLEQGHGTLGDRMACVHSQLLAVAPSALLVGADSPQFTPALLLQACAWLDHPGPRCVIGPARDGGFWLFGSNVAFPASAWTAVTYSRGDTATAFVAALSAARQAEWTRLSTLVDVDDDRDLAQLRNELDQIGDPSPQQVALGNWLRDPTQTPCETTDATASHPTSTHPKGDTHEHE